MTIGVRNSKFNLSKNYLFYKIDRDKCILITIPPKESIFGTRIGHSIKVHNCIFNYFEYNNTNRSEKMKLVEFGMKKNNKYCNYYICNYWRDFRISTF